MLFVVVVVVVISLFSFLSFLFLVLVRSMRVPFIKQSNHSLILNWTFPNFPVIIFNLSDFSFTRRFLMQTKTATVWCITN